MFGEKDVQYYMTMIIPGWNIPLYENVLMPKDMSGMSLNSFVKALRKAQCKISKIKKPSSVMWAVFSKHKNGRYKLVVCSPNFKKEKNDGSN